MPTRAPHFFETTVLDPEGGEEALFVSMPASVLSQVNPEAAALLRNPVVFATDVLGLRLGPVVPEPDDLAEVFYASLGGRVVPFDDRSFDRWRRVRLQAPAARQSRFALEIATMELVTVEESPLGGASLASLATRGTSIVVGGWDLAASHPLQGLGVLVVGQFGFVLAQVVRGVSDEVYLSTRYHMRRLLRTPPDWRP